MMRAKDEAHKWRELCMKNLLIGGSMFLHPIYYHIPIRSFTSQRTTKEASSHLLSCSNQKTDLSFKLAFHCTIKCWNIIFTDFVRSETSKPHLRCLSDILTFDNLQR
ncbi:hypothetical protein S245_065892 [Arachis hypogaea]